MYPSGQQKPKKQKKKETKKEKNKNPETTSRPTISSTREHEKREGHEPAQGQDQFFTESLDEGEARGGGWEGNHLNVFVKGVLDDEKGGTELSAKGRQDPHREHEERRTRPVG